MKKGLSASFLFLIGLGMGSPAAFAATKYQLSLGDGTATSTFLAVGNPTAIRIRGTTERPKGTIVAEPSGLSGAVSIPVSTLDTGIALRNQHMKDKYLEVSKFPEIVFKPSKIGSLDAILKNPSFTGTGLPVEGKMLLHGVERPISGKADLTRKGASMNGTFFLKLNIRDFSIDVPQFAGVTVTNEVEVKIDFTAPFRGQE